MKIKIVGIDEFGFLGREFHPSKEDVGVVGKVLRYDLLRANDGHPVLTDTDRVGSPWSRAEIERSTREDSAGMFLALTTDGASWR